MNVALRPEHLNILSICTGGGGLDLGVELAIPSSRSVCLVEREAFAVAQLVSAMEAGLMDPAPIWSDARTFDGRAWRGAVDGLIGGIPCQPHSLAGRKQGSNDARDLWSTARRIIVQSGVWFVVIENVGGMLAAGSDEIAGAQRVFRDLHKLGFETEGGLFTASEVGASHQRERIFILGVANPFSQGLERGPRRTVRQQQQTLERGSEALDDAINRGWPARRHHNRSDVRHEPDAASKHSMADAESIGRGEGRTKPELRRGRSASPVSGGAMGDSESVVREDVIDRAGETGQRVVSLDRSTGGNGHGRRAAGDLSREREDAAPSWVRPLFAPGPTDISSWCDTLTSSPELEPAFRRVADGLASRMDIGRVDRLRMLGNGVVPLQAGYALRTLVTRLAARGSAGAARLVRMMEIAA